MAGTSTSCLSAGVRCRASSEGDELDEFNWNWDWDLDDADSKQDFAVIGADNEVQVVRDDAADQFKAR